MIALGLREINNIKQQMKALCTKVLTITLAYLLLCLPTFAQLNLKPTIGVGTLPNDADSICTLGTVGGGGFGQLGPMTGDTIAHFNLWATDGSEMDIETILLQGKPVLMVTGSYTCPVFRNKVGVINDLQVIYGNSLEIFIVYVVEAHPIAPDISPYFGVVNDAGNPSVGINVLQPRTYGERKAVVQEMTDTMQFDVPIYLDGPCNEWWYEFGPAPNNAYIIDQNGAVYIKHGWFDKAPQEDIYCDIDSLLNNPCGGGGTANGSFDFTMVSSSTSITDVPGATMLIEGQFTNNSGAPVIIDVDRVENNVPTDWGSSICVDVCLPPTTSYTNFQLDDGQTQSYHMYFYTGSLPDSGNVLMSFTNQADPANNFDVRFYGYTDPGFVGLNEDRDNLAQLPYPNPVEAGGTIQLVGRTSITVAFYDVTGKLIHTVDNNDEPIDLPADHFAPGVYLYKISQNGLLTKSGRLVVQ